MLRLNNLLLILPKSLCFTFLKSPSPSPFPFPLPFSIKKSIFSSISVVKQNPLTSPITRNRRREFFQFTTAMEANAESDNVNAPLVVTAAAAADESGPDFSSETVQNPNPNRGELFEAVSGGGGGDGGGGAMEREERRVLPEEMMKNVVYLTCDSSAEGGSCDVYVVGTAHVSQDSCREVQAVISYLKPQVVFLELCSSRVSILSPQNLQVPTIKEMLDMWQKKNMNIFGVLYSWFLAKVASKLEVFPGSEFRVALEEAVKYGGKVILGDRPVRITLQRTWGKMSLWHKTKFLYSILFQAVFLPNPEDLTKMLKDMDDVDMLTLVIQEMSKAFPTLMETLLYERDLYMSSTLLRVASEHTSVVAVVGKGHLQGIKKHWKQPVEVNDLLTIPGRKSFFSATRIATTVGVTVAGVAIVSGIYLSGKR